MTKLFAQFLGAFILTFSSFSIAFAGDAPTPVAAGPGFAYPQSWTGTQAGWEASQAASRQAECKTAEGDLASNKATIASLCAGKDQETCYEGMGKQLSQTQKSQALKEEKERLDGKAEKAEDKVIDLQKQIYEVQKEMQEKQKEAADKQADLQKQIKASEIKRSADLRNLDKERREDYNKLRTSLSESRKRLVEVTIDDKTKISRMNQACKKEIEEYRRQRKTQRTRKSSIEGLLSTSNDESRCTTYTEEINNVIISNNSNMKELQEDINEIQTQINELKAQNDEAKIDAKRSAIEEQINLTQQLNNEYQNATNMNQQYNQRLEQLKAQLAGKRAEMNTYKTEYQTMASTNAFKGNNGEPVGTMMATTYQTNLDTLRNAYASYSRAYASGASSGCTLGDYQDLNNTIINQGAQ